jgi:membrane fusion protein (multidrug efflux system)
VLSLLLIVACHGTAGDRGEAEARVPVVTELVRQDSLPQELRIVGRLTPAPGSSVVLSAPGDAVVRQVTVRVGDAVGSGAPLLLLDAPGLEASAVSLRAQAEAASRDAERQAELLREGIAARRSVEEKEAAATSARAAATAADRLFAQARVTSPFAGRVQRVMVGPGERVSAATPLVEVLRPGAVDLLAQVTAGDLGRLHPGQPARVIAEGSASEVPAVVRSIAPAVDSVSNAGAVTLRVESRPGIVPGAGASAVVTVGLLRNALVVPDSALVLVGDSLAVFRVGPDSSVHHVSVIVDGRTAGRAAVRGELRSGDRIVSGGGYGLVDGMKVQPGP